MTRQGRAMLGLVAAGAGLAAAACTGATEPDAVRPGVYVLATFDAQSAPPFAYNDVQCGGSRTIDLIVADTLFLNADSSARRVVWATGRSFRDGVEQPTPAPRPIDWGSGRFGRDGARLWVRYWDARRGVLGPASWYRVRGADLVDSAATGVRCADGTGTPNRHVETVYTRR